MENIQTLKLADALFPALDDRTKRATIRNGIRDIKLDLLRFEGADEINNSRLVNVTRVQYTRVGNLTARDAYIEGAANVIVLYEDLKKFYPTLNAESPVTIIEFDLVENKNER